MTRPGRDHPAAGPGAGSDAAQIAEAMNTDNTDGDGNDGVDTGVEEGAGRPLPEAGVAEVHIVAASADVARRVAQVLRFRFAATEQRGQPAQDPQDPSGATRLHLLVDTVHHPEMSGPFQLRLVGGSQARSHEVTEPPGPPQPPTPDEPSGDRPTT